MNFIIDFHTHTYHSYDCLMRPEKILRIASERGLSGIVINDHNTVKGGLECSSINKYPNLQVIIGSEIKTTAGDITGIFLKKEIEARNFSDVITEIKNQGGLTILNHPFVGHKLDEINFSGIDLVEGFNGRLSEEQNNRAVELANHHGKPIIAGSDSHTYGEIANCKTYYENIKNLFLPLKTEYKRCSPFAPIYSQIVKGIKQKDTILVSKIMLSLPGKIIKYYQKK